MGTGHCSLWCLDVLNEDQTKAPLASNGFGGQAKWWPCCTKPRPLKPGPKQTSSYTNGASCKVCINQGNVLFHMILVSRRSRRFLSFQFKSNLISMFKQRKTSPKISEASCKVSKHPQSSNADSHHVVTFLCFAWTWYSGHILSRIYSGSQTGLFLHLLPVMHCLYHSKIQNSSVWYGNKGGIGPGFGRSKSTYMKNWKWTCTYANVFTYKAFRLYLK